MWCCSCFNHPCQIFIPSVFVFFCPRILCVYPRSSALFATQHHWSHYEIQINILIIKVPGLQQIGIYSLESWRDLCNATAELMNHCNTITHTSTFAHSVMLRRYQTHTWGPVMLHIATFVWNISPSSIMNDEPGSVQQRHCFSRRSIFSALLLCLQLVGEHRLHRTMKWQEMDGGYCM